MLTLVIVKVVPRSIDRVLKCDVCRSTLCFHIFFCLNFWNCSFEICVHCRKCKNRENTAYSGVVRSKEYNVTSYPDNLWFWGTRCARGFRNEKKQENLEWKYQQQQPTTNALSLSANKKGRESARVENFKNSNKSKMLFYLVSWDWCFRFLFVFWLHLTYCTNDIIFWELVRILVMIRIVLDSNHPTRLVHFSSKIISAIQYKKTFLCFWIKSTVAYLSSSVRFGVPHMHV